MSETRDTLILPCRHLCLCNACADSLRYQANCCPICRAPFRALLQIRAVQKGIGGHLLQQSTLNSGNGETVTCEQHLPPGYVPISLIEALNGPSRYLLNQRSNVDCGAGDGNDLLDSGENTQLEHHNKPTSPLKSSDQRRLQSKKNASTSTNTNEMNNDSGASSNLAKTNKLPAKPMSNAQEGEEAGFTVEKRSSPDKMQIVNERERKSSTKGIKRNSKHNVSGTSLDILTPSTSLRHELDEDSENENLSPLLSNVGATGFKTGILESSSMQRMGNDEDHDDVSEADEFNDDLDDDETAVTAAAAASLDDDDAVLLYEDDDEHDDIANKEYENLVDCSEDKNRKSSSSHSRMFKKSKDLLKSSEDSKKIPSKITAKSGNTNVSSVIYMPSDSPGSSLNAFCGGTHSQELDNDCIINIEGSCNENLFQTPAGKKNLHKKSTSVGNIVNKVTPGVSASGSVSTVEYQVHNSNVNNVTSLPGNRSLPSFNFTSENPNLVLLSIY